MGNKTVTPVVPVTNTSKRDSVVVSSARQSIANPDGNSSNDSTRRSTIFAPVTSPMSNERESSMALPIVDGKETKTPRPSTNPKAPIQTTDRISVISPDNSTVSPTNSRPPTSTKPTTSATAPTQVNTDPKTPVAEAPQRTDTKTSIAMSLVNSELIQPTSPLGKEQWYKWKRVEDQHNSGGKTSAYLTEETKSSDMTIPSPDDLDHEEKKTTPPPAFPHLIATPSYQLRTTAVSNESNKDKMLLERDPSMHPEMSIFSYYLPKHSERHGFGNHTKSTMYQMNTRSKKTPLPTPSLLLLTKNFNDGTFAEDVSVPAPTTTFVSLGLQNDLEFDSKDRSYKEQALLRRAQDENFPRTTMFYLDVAPNNENVLNETNLSSHNERTARKSSQPLASILKKPSFQGNRNAFVIPEEPRRNDFSNHSSTVSFNLPPLPSKASQSISKSERLFSRHLISH